MGDILSAGGTTTSFSNTPQAKDDSYSYIEDLLRNDSKLYNVATNTIFLDVMSNDLGGNAKSLFSVEDGDGKPLTTDFELVQKDVNSLGVSNWEATLRGNWVRINNGKIEFRISDGSGVPGQGRSVDTLAAGQQFADEFVYAIKLGNGTLSEATVKIGILGTNDGPVANADTGAGTENQTLTIDVLANDTDVDDGHVLTVTGASVAPGSGSVSVVDNKVVFNPGTDFDHLAKDATATVTVSYSIKDEHGATSSSTVTITVTGTNDGPVINSNGGGSSAAVSVAENSTVVTTVAATDVDSASISYSIVGGADAAKFAIDASTGVLSFIAAPNFEAPGDAGANNVYDVVVRASDGTLFDDQSIAVTVTNVNTAPVITSNGGGNTTTIAYAENGTGAITTVIVSDDGENQPVTYSLSGTDASKFTINAAGVLSFVSSPNFEAPTDSDGNNSYVVTVTASDGGLNDSQTITVNVTDVVEAVVANIKFVPTSTDYAGSQLPGGEVFGHFVAYDASGSVVPGATFSVTGSTGSLVVNTATGAVSGGLNGQNVFTFAIGSGSVVEDVRVQVGNGNGNTITGTTGIDIFFGVNGDDTLNGPAPGSANDDTIYGDANDDTLYGGDGDDYLIGGDGVDLLLGGNGHDYLRGGAGSDTLTGGADVDTFVLTSAATSDSITDYVAGEIIDITALLSTGGPLAGFVRLTAAGQLQIDADGGGNGFVTVATLTAGISATVRYTSGGTTATVVIGSGAPPIAIDLDGDGEISFLSMDDGTAFDYGGGAVSTAWVAGNDGILVRDANHDGSISADEIVFATTGSDLEGLAVYDTNGDGQLSAADQHFADFGVWQDADGDGVLDLGEYQTLSAGGIASISLSSDRQSYSAANDDVTVVGTGSFTRADGSTGVLADAVFATRDRALTEQGRAIATGATPGTLVAASMVAALGLEDIVSAMGDVDGEHDRDGSWILPTDIRSVPEAMSASANHTVDLKHADGHSFGEGSMQSTVLFGSETVQLEMLDLPDPRSGAELQTIAIDTHSDPGLHGSLVGAMLGNLAGLETMSALLTIQATYEPAESGSVDLETAAVEAIVADAVDDTVIDALISGIVDLAEPRGYIASAGHEGAGPEILNVLVGNDHNAMLTVSLHQLADDTTAALATSVV